MSASDSFWIPSGIPAELQVAASIPGTPPETVGEHRRRLEAYLAQLVRELDENVEPGYAAAVAFEVTMDPAFQLPPNQATPGTVAALLMQTDGLMSRMVYEENLGPGDKSPEMQEAARESSLEDRLAGLSLW